MHLPRVPFPLFLQALLPNLLWAHIHLSPPNHRAPDLASGSKRLQDQVITHSLACDQQPYQKAGSLEQHDFLRSALQT